MRAYQIFRRAALVSLFAMGGGCAHREPPRLAEATAPEAETATGSIQPRVAPVPQQPWRLRYTRL